jgi:hypothetical protein
MDHVQSVTLLEATNQEENKEVFFNKYVGFKHRKNENNDKQNDQTDGNNNETKEKFDPLLQDLEETSLLGLMTFKANIKWRNTLSISLLHLVAVICAVLYIPKIFSVTTIWGKCK